MTFLTIISKILLLLFCALAAYFDIKSRQIPIVIFIPAFVFGTVLSLLSRSFTIPELLLGITPGIFLLLIAFLSRQSVGLADALTFIVTGTYLGLTCNIWLLLISLLLCALIGLISIIFKKVKRKSSVPFLPFVFTGYIFLLAVMPHYPS